MSDKLSIIVPVLNEGAQLAAALDALQQYRQRGHEVIVVDGGSRDGSVTIARKNADRVLMSGPGRALQMNTGAEAASHEILLFLHADSRLPEQADRLISTALQPRASIWGRFDVRLSSPRPVFRLIETAINWRSAISGIATGDQAIFVAREFFEKVGSYDRLPLMEDVALSRKLLRFARPERILTPVRSSSRKWECEGVVRTTLLMWQLRTAYFFGVHPDRLVQRYYPPDSSADSSTR
jgi:rSAM/selenodomain-associated transferase 2